MIFVRPGGQSQHSRRIGVSSLRTPVSVPSPSQKKGRYRPLSPTASCAWRRGQPPEENLDPFGWSQEILWKNTNSWKTLARPMFSIVFSQEFMENIGQANVFHEFAVFPRFLADPRRFSGKPQIHGKTLARPMFSTDPRRFSGKPQIHGKHWPGQCFPLFLHRNSWKTLARPMFSMNFWFFRDSWLIPGDSLENHKFMENIGQANVFHCFFTGIHGKHWPGQCFP